MNVRSIRTPMRRANSCSQPIARSRHPGRELRSAYSPASANATRTRKATGIGPTCQLMYIDDAAR